MIAPEGALFEKDVQFLPRPFLVLPQPVVRTAVRQDGAISLIQEAGENEWSARSRDS